MVKKKVQYTIFCTACNFWRDSTRVDESSAYVFNHAVATGHALTVEKGEVEN